MEDKNKIYTIIHDTIRYFKSREEIPPTDEMDDLWHSITTKVEHEKSVASRRILFIRITSVSVAAVVIMAFGLKMSGLLGGGQDICEVASQFAKVSVADDEVQLVVSPDQTVSFKKGATVTYSSDGEITVDEQQVQEGGKSTKGEEEEYNQIIVPKGKHTRLLLADGSSLHINSGTRVVYPRSFKKNRREIFVDGEIYIDVKRDESSPFFVKTAQFEIEVLGTAFNVNAYSEEAKAEVVVVRGLVNVKDHAKQEVKLTPDLLANINEGLIIGKHTVDASQYISWTQGVLMLNAEPLGGVLRKLQRYYGVNIVFEPSIEKLEMYGGVDLNCPLSEVLRRISVTAPIEYQELQSGFQITKCK